ncbi:MAG: acetyl-CoA carboxylase biotin carboxyl carrier [Sphingomonas bacterium]|jgi:acetyl-CoA carboxylase biotin carboxyl carrier protein|nr:acetyl-CoA carboxylase biotin carboxyl carrier [Sphingomonas bacterium]MDB5718194.1 acetyl-CoA carboxylase biotin carboxyl carrier [Sphingomonas bacterium]
MPDQSNGGMQVDPDLVRQLAELLDATQLTEIEVQDGDRRIRVARKAAAVHAGPTYAAAPAAAPAALHPPVAAADPAAPAGEHPGTIRSPMVGTVYLSAEPGGKPFVGPGDKVAAGDTLLIVEAMKVMNPILSPRAGTVRTLIVENGQPVEFDQPLVVVE